MSMIALVIIFVTLVGVFDDLFYPFVIVIMVYALTPDHEVIVNNLPAIEQVYTDSNVSHSSNDTTEWN